MDPTEAVARLRARLDPALRVEADGDGGILVFLRRDMLHLDADALHDRLHHWTLTRLQPRHPGLTATLSFRHARPASPYEDAELDLQEAFLDLEPTLRLDLREARDTERALDDLVRLAPRLVELVEAQGRPAGFRAWDVGAPE